VISGWLSLTLKITRFEISGTQRAK
jgi:hypothetical protein